MAEMAIAVADAWQHHGVGRALLAHAIAWAQVHGIDRLVASILSSNAAMFGLLRSMGLPVFYGACAEGEVDAYLDLRSHCAGPSRGLTTLVDHGRRGPPTVLAGGPRVRLRVPRARQADIAPWV